MVGYTLYFMPATNVFDHVTNQWLGAVDSGKRARSFSFACWEVLAGTGALEGGCGGEGRGAVRNKGQPWVACWSFFAVVFQYRFEDVSDRLIERFWPCLGA